MGPAHLVFVPNHVRIRVHLVQGAFAARASCLRSNARKTLASLKKRKRIVSYTSEATGKQSGLLKLLLWQMEDWWS
jgi:hypothetical protein